MHGLQKTFSHLGFRDLWYFDMLGLRRATSIIRSLYVMIMSCTTLDLELQCLIYTECRSQFCKVDYHG